MADPISGTWHIVGTSLPFWRTCSAPAVTYAPLPDGRILDAVTYVRNGRERLVLGVDERVGVGFVWRGLQFATGRTSSRWRVVAADETAASAEDRWAVTAFEKTLFTPAGIDIYCRARVISPAAREAAVAALTSAGLGDHELITPAAS